MSEDVTRHHGRAWTFGDNVPTDSITPTEYVMEPMETRLQHVLEDRNPDFPSKVEPGDIVVAGQHFGQSSGRAVAPKTLKATGIGCVVAESFARTFYRNGFEIGLPVLSCPGVLDLVSDGDIVSVGLASGVVSNETTGESLEGDPVDPFLLKMIEAGGLIAFAKRGIPGLEN